MLPPTHFIPLLLATFGRMLLDPLFWTLAALVGLQYRRAATVKSRLYGAQVEPVWPRVLEATLVGVAGGLAGSGVIALVGVSLNGIGIAYLWGLAVLLMLLSPRLLCFSYAGGILSASYLLLGFPRIDVPELMGLVAVLHMVESLLILASGHLGAVPVYTRNAAGHVVGAFHLQKFWPIPVIAFMLFAVPFPVKDMVSMPGWWPLIRPAYPGDTESLTLVMKVVPVVAALGYSDLAMASLPREKSRRSAGHLALYSVVLLGLAVMASHYRWLSWAPALFGPLGHEVIIRWGQRAERESPPLFVDPATGVRVLDVLPRSPAKRLGIRSGDVLRTVNGLPVDSRSELAAVLEGVEGWLEVEYLSYSSRRTRRGKVPCAYAQPLGLILVPGPADHPHVDFSGRGVLVRWWQRPVSRYRR